MQRDIRGTSLYREAEALYESVRRPGSGCVSDASDVHVSPDGRQVVFAGTVLDALEGAPLTRICQIDLVSGQMKVLTFGPRSDRFPRFSPDGRYIAFVSERGKGGDFQLYLLDRASGAARATQYVQGWIEYLQWSPDGKRILLGVAGFGADVAGGQGAIASKEAAQNLPTWMPSVESDDEAHRWRRVWVYELDRNHVRQVSNEDTNVWESVWCGNQALAALISPGPGEGLWYTARVGIIQLETGDVREVYAPREQLGCTAASPSGNRLAVVDAICSDRLFVAGDLHLIDTVSGAVRNVSTQGVDVTYAEWRSDRRVLLTGHRGFETVVGICDADTGTFTEVWASREVTSGFFYAVVAGIDETADCVLVIKSFTRGPEVGSIRGGEYRMLRSFDLGYADQAAGISAVERVTWSAPDGLEIQGWLLLPKGRGPYPLIMNVHGGPVWHWRPLWLGAPFLMLLRRGYAVFLPNPRGSTGRGQDFIRHVVGDIGGADTRDYLSGVDCLVGRGVVDPARVGVTGGSYGGFMTSWLITQDTRFAAAVPVSPVTNQVTEHLLSNIPHFQSMFLADKYSNPGGRYFERSPIMHAHKVKTPTLHICGAMDRCTPAEEAMQFHRALRENGTQSVLVTYPEEGHGVRTLPAAIDFSARVVSWFEEYMPASYSR